MLDFADLPDYDFVVLRAAGMVHWEALPLPGLYVGDYGEQYGHRRKEVLTFEMQPPTQTHRHVCV
jgi:hypothetical protein